MKKIYLLASIAAAGIAPSLSASEMAYQPGQWVVRLGASTTEPREDGDNIKLNGSVLVLGGQTSSLGITNNTQLGITVEYLLDRHWGIELLAATPFEHAATGKGAIQGVDVADFKHLPPTLSGIYHFTPISGFQPYVGAGLNYTLIFDEELTPQAKTTFAGLGLTGGKIDLEDSVGLSFQAGVDYHIDESWLINASARWIDIDTDAEIRFDSGDRLTSSIEVDPWVYTVSVGMKFLVLS